MKNKLAENLVRFGAKNLTESNIEKLSEATSINENVTVEVGNKRRPNMGQLKIKQKAQIQYKGTGEFLTPVSKTANATYEIDLYIRSITAEFGNLFPSGGTIILDTLEMNKESGGPYIGTEFGGDVKLNQSIPFTANKPSVSAKFMLPVPAPDANQSMENGKPSIQFTTNDRYNRPIGLAADYVLRGRIQSQTIDRATYVANVEKAIASGRLKDTDGGKARIAKWDSTNPSGVGKPFKSVNFYSSFRVNVPQVAVPVLPSQARG